MPSFTNARPITDRTDTFCGNWCMLSLGWLDLVRVVCKHQHEDDLGSVGTHLKGLCKAIYKKQVLISDFIS
jgi:hypothetical protein